MNSSSAPKTHAGVVFDPGQGHESRHEAAVHLEIARRLARLQGLAFLGEFDPLRMYSGRVYFVPNQVVVGVERARQLGIESERDLFGAVVPEAFVATKAITHPLISPVSRAPAGWSGRFAGQVEDAVLTGVTAFALEDAYEAGRRLLSQGPVRLKAVCGRAGRGQVTATSSDQLVRELDAMDRTEVESHGLVLEEHLDQVRTYSVGQVRVGAVVVSYYGCQRLTRDNGGSEVYGGTELVAVRGGFDAVLALALPDEVRTAVTQAQTYDTAAQTCFPWFYASRRNYDVAQGRDARGRWRSGVLEQSWRIGGASGAELVALEALCARPDFRAVRASSVEAYGRDYSPPADSVVLFSGDDAEVGYITKFVTGERYGGG